LKAVLENLPDTFERGMKIGQIKRGFFRMLGREQVSSSGYVIDTLEAALWCCYHSEDFETSLITAVNLGEDADTVGGGYGTDRGCGLGRLASCTSNEEHAV
jgi:ADP-ribosyl-[dinitrogen reductase] hydrolase